MEKPQVASTLTAPMCRLVASCSSVSSGTSVWNSKRLSQVYGEFGQSADFTKAYIEAVPSENKEAISAQTTRSSMVL